MFDEACICVLPDYLISEIEWNGSPPSSSWANNGYDGAAFTPIDEFAPGFTGLEYFEKAVLARLSIPESSEILDDESCEMGTPLLPADLFTPSSIGSSYGESTSLPAGLPEEVQFDDFVGVSPSSPTWY
jgi:hypothetical protein